MALFPPHGALGVVVRSPMAMLTALVLALQALQSEACTCFPQEYCELTSATDILVSASVLDRTAASTSSEDEDSSFPSYFGDVIYTLRVIEVYKTDTKLKCGQKLDFVTAGSSAACGLYLEIGEDYVVGMNSRDDGNLYANLCGPTRSVDYLSADMLEVLENGGDCIDPCQDWACISLQECVVTDGKPGCQYIEGLEPVEVSYDLEDGGDET